MQSSQTRNLQELAFLMRATSCSCNGRSLKHKTTRMCASTQVWLPEQETTLQDMEGAVAPTQWRGRHA